MIHSFTDEHLGSFQQLAVVNSVAINTGVHKFFWIGDSGFLGIQWNFTQQKEGTPTFRNTMGGTGEHCAKWNKPVGERQIPYNLTYKWNLMNKIN